MIAWLGRFWAAEEGQDIIEYTLLITFIAIACMWGIGAGKDSIQGIWTTNNNNLSLANTAASGGR